ncbi:hypothetical protein AB6G46_10820 [Providencia hangzhouensis]|uniref:hypothetical protein n=1 Tax=Providencia hangzhouensis TaxID=3031799 RepID=UPI0024AA5816|nr:hypothetical protein [Providencia rettgeri]
MAFTDFKTFWNGLSKRERQQFADSANLTVQYISIHLRYCSRSVSIKTARRLQKAFKDFGKEYSLEQIADHFMK